LKPYFKERETLMISIGHKDFVKSSAIVEVIRRGSARVRRLTNAAAQSGRLINVTRGRRPGSIILLKSNHVVLSALRPEIIESRLKETLDPGE
jgi:regulator of extracellular matrix RemA (YlzA/DUF370 family)